MSLTQSTGIFIPVDKKSLFIMVFETILLHRHNILITFKRAKNGNSEVNFVFKGKLSQKRLAQIEWHLKTAKKFVEENLFKIQVKKGIEKSKNVVTPTRASPKYTDNLIYVENCGPVLTPRRLSLRSSSTIDLTEDSFQGSEPEVIVLDDHPAVTCSKKYEKPNIIINVDETSKCLPRTSKSIGSDIQVVGINNVKPSVHSSVPEDEVTELRRIYGLTNKLSNLRRSNRKSNSFIKTPIERKVAKLACSRIQLNYGSNDSKSHKNKFNEQKRNNKKALRNVINIIPTTSSKTDSQHTTTLSNGVLNYYTHIGKTVNKEKLKSPKQRHSLITVVNNSKSRPSPSARKRKSKIPSPREKLSVSSDLSSSSNKRQRDIFPRNVKCKHESNIFNPNPNVNIEGLRPIAIDGSNVAVGHGKGTFSTKGLKICVDYFVTQGHKQVKVFLPLTRQKCFSPSLLEELKSKCDMVFTPSRIINGRWTTSYDDRFIVQYAVEFGAVIVSTDNFRDLLAENPRWTKAIQERLLMFTWIDDFLMFPMDPMGKHGPTLDEFLKF